MPPAATMTSLPSHVAIIMDGNGRWAQRRSRARVHGHIRGARRVKAIVREASKVGIKALTLFAFSTENWLRPESERRVLWSLLSKYLLREREELKRENVRLRVIGEVGRLDPALRKTLDETVRFLDSCSGLTLTFAVSYGARRELVVAAQEFARHCIATGLDPSVLDEEMLESFLATKELGSLADVDLVIRTGGELRMSNFLLWQAAYAEYYFTETCWPDFVPDEFRSAIESFAGRERRYGMLSSQIRIPFPKAHELRA